MAGITVPIIFTEPPVVRKTDASRTSREDVSVALSHMVQGHLLQKPQETDPDVNSSRARTLPRSPSRARSRHSVSVRKG